MTKETPEQIMQRALTALAFANGVHERLAVSRALVEAQRAQEARDFGERKAQQIAALETPQEHEARVKAGLKARWAQPKARALKTIARVEAAEWNQKRNSPPQQSVLSRLVQRHRNATTTAERRAARMAIQAELRKDNPSSQRTIYKMSKDGATPFQRLKSARTPAEYRDALKDMAVLAEIMKKRGR